MYKTKKEARIEGQRVRKILATQIKIKDVKLDVFKSLGWHWTLRHKHFGINPIRGATGYFCLISPNGYGTGRSLWTIDDMTVKDPYKLLTLIKRILGVAKKEVKELQTCIDEVEALEKCTDKRNGP